MRIRQTAVRIANLTFVSPDLAPSDNRSHSTRFKLLRLKWRGRRDGDHTTHKLLLQFRITASSRTAQRRQQPSGERKERSLPDRAAKGSNRPQAGSFCASADLLLSEAKREIPGLPTSRTTTRPKRGSRTATHRRPLLVLQRPCVSAAFQLGNNSGAGSRNHYGLPTSLGPVAGLF